MAYEVMDLQNHYLSVLSKAQKKFRKTYAGTSEWIKKEHDVMLKEVNKQLKIRGRDPITYDTLRNAEKLALGHVDYASKFSLYLAQVTLGTY